MFKHKNFSAGRFLITILIFGLFFIQAVYSSPVTGTTAKDVAKNFLSYIQADNTIDSIEELEVNNQVVAYLVNLNPSGYILIAGDDIRVPVKGYSLKSGFHDLPKAYRQVLVDELGIYSFPSSAEILAEGAGTNDAYWKFLTNPSDISSIQAYTPDTYLITSQWGQSYPYNSFNPTIGGEYTLTGCVQTALGQLMKYHEHPATGSGVFTHQWNGQTLTAVMNRPFNWSIMPVKVDGSVPKYQRDEVALLMRDIGILNQASFGTTSTSTSFNYWDFSRAFGYAQISTMGINNGAFFTTITSEIDAERPVLLSMPGHMVIADGYASDGTGRKIHLNMGWEGSDDDYYYLDQTIVTSNYSFSPNHTIYYNIRPCEGGECSPYSATEGGKIPVIESALSDTVIDSGGSTLNIQAYDPDGHDVTLSTSSSCSGISAQLNSNLLTLTPQESNTYCQVKVQADSSDGTASKIFNTLVIDDLIYLGSGFDICGNFTSISETDEYYTYLSGNTTISGTRGFSNQAFYIWIENEAGTSTVAGPSDSSITYNFTSGTYRINISLSSGSSFYQIDDKSNYIVTVSTDNSTYSVTDLADDMSITLQEFSTEPGDLLLSSGWNLISLVIEPENTVISSVLSGIAGKYESVWTYDGGWKVYDPVYPDFSDLASMEAGKGYWINMSEAGDISLSGSDATVSIELRQGWNLVGLNSTESLTTTSAISSISDKVISVWSYDSGWKTYDPEYPDFSDLTSMEPGKGYWINITQACIWEL